MSMATVEHHPSVDAKSFRECMSRVTAAVHVVTAAEAGEIAGVTATAVCSLSDSPCSLLTCLYREGRTRTLLKEGTALAVNTLRGCHQEIAAAFAGQGMLSMEERFRQGSWEIIPGQAPILSDALVSFRCKVDSITEYGSHSIVICRVLDVVRHQDEETLLYGGRQYARLSFH